MPYPKVIDATRFAMAMAAAWQAKIAAPTSHDAKQHRRRAHFELCLLMSEVCSAAGIPTADHAAEQFLHDVVHLFHDYVTPSIELMPCDDVDNVPALLSTDVNDAVSLLTSQLRALRDEGGKLIQCDTEVTVIYPNGEATHGPMDLHDAIDGVVDAIVCELDPTGKGVGG